MGVNEDLREIMFEQINYHRIWMKLMKVGLWIQWDFLVCHRNEFPQEKETTSRGIHRHFKSTDRNHEVTKRDAPCMDYLSTFGFNLW